MPAGFVSAGTSRPTDFPLAERLRGSAGTKWARGSACEAALRAPAAGALEGRGWPAATLVGVTEHATASADAPERLFSINRLAAHLDIGRDGVYRLIRSGELHPVRIGHRYRFLPNDVAAYLERHRVGEPDPPFHPWPARAEELSFR